MSSSNLAGNRNSTPEGSNTLRPPSSRQGARPDHSMRASADMGAFSASTLPSRAIRPASEVYYNQANTGQGQGNIDDMDKATQQWLADIDQYEATLEEMATATLDQDFKDELSAIEQWFKVLSEAERTAALYALLQQTTQVQIRFFIQVLQEMAQNHPMSGILSPASFGQKGQISCIHGLSVLTSLDPMSQKMTDAMSKLTIEGSRHSLGIIGRPPPSPGAKRLSGLDPSMINSMFPDAAAAIAKQKEQFTQQTGMAPPSTRNSIIGDRTSLIAPDRNSLVVPPSISAPEETKKENSTPSAAWGRSVDAQRPKSSSSQTPMGQFTQPPPSAGLRSPRPISGDTNLQNTTLNAADPTGLSLLSPYAGGSWASMVNTPMAANFNTQQSATQADMVANATAMKLAALSTVNNRIQFDDVRKYRRTRSTDHQNGAVPPSPGLPFMISTNEHGQVLSAQQAAALQAQQLAAMQARRSRPNSPGVLVSGAPNLAAMGFHQPPQNSQFLTPFDGGAAALAAGIPLGQFGVGLGSMPGSEGYGSDHGDGHHQRGRSPRGRRGSSRPPEDPTDMALLQDVPAWLRSLRLHKYTDMLKGLNWKEIVELDDEGLKDRGVAAVGARNKMLKVSLSRC
jgi:RNA-binding protein VTS1